MVRADGTNDASVFTRESVGEIELAVTPGSCTPLVEMTMANRFPAAALDGVGTYWLGQSTTISMFTLRFPDASSGRGRTRAARRRAQGLRGSADPGPSPGGEPDRGQGQPLDAEPARVTGQRSAGLPADRPDGISAIQLLSYENTLSWQYRYEPGATSYSTLAADQLMSGLRSQLDTVVAARPR